MNRLAITLLGLAGAASGTAACGSAAPAAPASPPGSASAASSTAAVRPAPCAAPRAVAATYALAFPETGLDDPAAYEGYRTRLFEDAAGNTLQVYVKEGEGRVVNLWADAANESIGFTARDAAGAPAGLDWASDSVCVSSAGAERSMEYRLRADAPEVLIGHVLLGSMRVERDFQYPGRHLEPFGPSFVPQELTRLVELMGGLPDGERRRHAGLLNARDVAEVEARLRPTLRLATEGGRRIARIERPSLDARNRLRLEIEVPADEAGIERDGDALRVVARTGRPLVLTVRVTTDAPPLTPLGRAEIFNAEFLAFHDAVRAAAHDPAARPASDPRVVRFRLLERQVRGLELLSSREKLMAGLPNYATYFGRDMLVTALLMQPIWAPGMNEHVIASVLRKLAADGQVSHEEALGGQAIREHAALYNDLVARGLTDEAAAILGDVQRVRENYAMVDDEYQFPVLVARYLTDPDVPAARKREFLLEPARADAPASRLTLLLRNLALIADRTAAYAREPVAGHLVGFPRRGDGGYHAASWRDSGAGYGNGRFAMDVNVVWVPNALESTAAILSSLRDLGIGDRALAEAAPALAASTLAGYLREPGTLQRAIATWRGAGRHFTLRLTAQEARARIDRKLASLPADEARYWAGVLEREPVPEGGLELVAVALDGAGEPIGIMSTDLGTRWFLDDLTGAALRDPRAVPDLVTELAVPFLPYPVGLLVDGLGPLVANDAYATPDVWAAFERDTYHSPRVVWGREVNLLLLGLMRQIDAARGHTGALRDARLRPYVTALEHGLRATLDAVEASGLRHNEVWSYRLTGGRVQPIRWGNSSDVQLWNLTHLVVEFQRARVEF
ncbi:MAG TPA: hypothetical protein VMM12_14555 [Longimicrobiales bacterium]|nr:hypothetical protein [Longimicrobiales bacterium]